jgi:RNA polymerase sigma-70 factor (ECF subfamily)
LKPQEQVAHLFRHEYGKLVALLSKRVGMQHIDRIEDAVQWAMLQALDVWRIKKLPKSPSAWLYQVSYRHLLSEFRTINVRNKLLTQYSSTDVVETFEHEDTIFSGEMNDAMLRMLFIACHESIPLESQLVFTLKSLCGFSIKEISHRLFIKEANVYKRFNRAKQYLQSKNTDLDALSNDECVIRLSSVHSILYLLFTEGYLSSHVDLVIRQDLCEEAIRLTKLLIESHLGNVSNSHALLALMYFHLARINTRQNNLGELLLLEQQNRQQWNTTYISAGMHYLAKSAHGDLISRYHIEAGIAAEHCISPSFKQTRWDKITASYALLHQISSSPLQQLNQAIAMAEWQGPTAGLAILESLNMPDCLQSSYYWYAVHADLYFRRGEHELASQYAKQAITLAPSDGIKNLLSQRLSIKS